MNDNKRKTSFNNDLNERPTKLHKQNEELECAISNDRHIVLDPVVLGCSHLCCRDCLIGKKSELNKCNVCSQIVDANMFTEVNPKSMLAQNIRLKIDSLLKRLIDNANNHLETLKSKSF